MISSSFYWRKELRQIHSKILRFQKLKQISEPSQLSFEKDIVMMSFIIRKLEQANELSTRYASKSYELEKIERTGSELSFRNWHRIDEHFDFSKKLKVSQNFKFISNAIIHSIYCFPLFDAQKNLTGICFASDAKGRELYILQIQDLLKALIEIAFGDILFITSSEESDGNRKYLRISNYDLVELGVSQFLPDSNFYVMNWSADELLKKLTPQCWTSNSIL